MFACCLVVDNVMLKMMLSMSPDNAFTLPGSACPATLARMHKAMQQGPAVCACAPFVTLTEFPRMSACCRALALTIEELRALLALVLGASDLVLLFTLRALADEQLTADKATLNLQVLRKQVRTSRDADACCTANQQRLLCVRARTFMARMCQQLHMRWHRFALWMRIIKQCRLHVQHAVTSAAFSCQCRRWDSKQSTCAQRQQVPRATAAAQTASLRSAS